MTLRIKHHICRKVLNNFFKSGPSESQVSALVSDISVGRLHDQGTEFHLSVTSIKKLIEDADIGNISEQTLKLPHDDVINYISTTESKGNVNLIFSVPKGMFIRSTLEDLTRREPLSMNGPSIVFDYSSPNIAKPFHMGHLRSTVVGNFLSNLHEWFGYKVIRLNYLGDWGTQFGLIKMGMQALNPSLDEMSQKPLHTLFQAYVLANREAEKDPSIVEKARKYFCSLERGEIDDMSEWKSYRDFTISELQKTYRRLGITFSDYAWESDYKASNVIPIIKNLQSQGFVSLDEEGRMVGTLLDGETVPLLKSDGTTLYLMRDIAAAIDRYSKFKFNKMYYIVDSSQGNHFNKLFSILKRLDLSWADNLQHISFGRVRGMSTRKGEVTFLSDILDESHKTMKERQILSQNTRVDGEYGDRISDILGVSAVIMADLKHTRQKSYTFNWDDAVNPKGDTGVRLQYTHCRLCSLKNNAGFSPATFCDPGAFTEPIAHELAFEISRFDDVMKRSFETLEANVLSSYLFNLCRVINRALIQLRVKGLQDLGPQRLLLFEEARVVLHQGMVILGLTPLSQM